MIKIEHTEVFGFDAAIRGMRNPMNSWDKSDSVFYYRDCGSCLHSLEDNCQLYDCTVLGKNDLALMKNLSNAGTDHSKYLRFITVTADITAPMFWWFEYDTYKAGTVKNSCSKMHRIHVKPFNYDDFSHEGIDEVAKEDSNIKAVFQNYIDMIEWLRVQFNETQEKKYWRALIEMLPESYNMRATVFLNYQVLKAMYHARKSHKLDCWIDFCRWCESLPYFREICVEV